jgi:membrane protein
MFPRRYHRLQFVRRVAEGLLDHRAFDHAATMAFYFFLGLIPLLVSCGIVVGHLVRSAGGEALFDPLYAMMPKGAAELTQRELVNIARSSVSSASLAPLTLLVFLWLTSTGFHKLMDVFEVMVGGKVRPWWYKRVIAVGWVLMTLAAVVLAGWILLLGNGLLHAVARGDELSELVRRGRGLLAERWQRQGAILVFTTIFALGLAAFYRYAIVHPPGIKRHVWSGTFVALGAWGLASWLFSAYVRSLGNYALYYGGVATVTITLLWLYLTSLSFLVGAEVNAQLEGIRDSALPSSARGGQRI